MNKPEHLESLLRELFAKRAADLGILEPASDSVEFICTAAPYAG